MTEEAILPLVQIPDSSINPLYRALHIEYLIRNTTYPGRKMEFYGIGLDSSHPWMLYWLISSYSTLKYDWNIPDSPVIAELDAKIEHQEEKYLHNYAIKTLSACLDANTGAFHGGGDMLFPAVPHILTTYAAIHCICLLGTPEAYALLDTERILRFLANMQQPDGCFCVYPRGESDMRACYAAASIAALCGLSTLTSQNQTATIDWNKTVQFIKSCQNYDGGFGALPGRESHGGYTFCAVATLALLSGNINAPALGLHDAFFLSDLSRDRLLHWLVHRQMSTEGGFQGRVNKLVDGCYSYWIGAVLNLFNSTYINRDEFPLQEPACVWNPDALIRFLLQCCQSVPSGGMLDKPSK